MQRYQFQQAMGPLLCKTQDPHVLPRAVAWQGMMIPLISHQPIWFWKKWGNKATNGVCLGATRCEVHLESSKSGTWCVWSVWQLKRHNVCSNLQYPVTLGFSCWSDEDYIGRISRVSRKVHGTSITLAFSTLRKSLIQYRAEWSRAMVQNSWVSGWFQKGPWWTGCGVDAVLYVRRTCGGSLEETSKRTFFWKTSRN